MTVPDFYVMNEEVMYKGDGGALAAGYWNHHWELSPEMSYLL